MEWLPISSYEQQLWDGDVVLLKDDDGNEARGSWGYEDESWDSETGEEWRWGAWHNEAGDSLGFDPDFWMPLPEPPQ